jgi:Skp family chaperone for outer membrane proteins
LPNLPAQLTAFSASYRVETDATEIVTGLQNASRDLSRSFREFGQTARSSQQETEAQIRTLEANRKALYQSMVAQISRAAQRVAQERHLDGVDISGSPPAGSVDLTSAVRADLAGF